MKDRLATDLRHDDDAEVVGANLGEYTGVAVELEGDVDLLVKLEVGGNARVVVGGTVASAGLIVELHIAIKDDVEALRVDEIAPGPKVRRRVLKDIGDREPGPVRLLVQDKHKADDLALRGGRRGSSAHNERAAPVHRLDGALAPKALRLASSLGDVVDGGRHNSRRRSNNGIIDVAVVELKLTTTHVVVVTAIVASAAVIASIASRKI